MVVIRVKRAGRVTAGVLVGTTLAVCLFRLVRHRLRKKSEYCAGDSGRGLGSKQPAVSQSEVMEAVDRVAGILRPDILEMNAWHGIHFREDVDQPVGLWHVQPQSVRQVLLISSWHPGSSVLGSLLSAYPGGSFWAEAAKNFSGCSVHLSPRTVERQSLYLKSFLDCRPESPELAGTLARSDVPLYSARYSERVWDACLNVDDAKCAICLDDEFRDKVCPLFPLRIIETTRFRVSSANFLLSDPSLPNLKVIFVVRDPRAARNSWQQSTMLSQFCMSSEGQCRVLEDDLEAAYQLRETFPDQVLLVRFEDLIEDAERLIAEVLSFLELPSTPDMINFYHSHYGVKKPEKGFFDLAANFLDQDESADHLKDATSMPTQWRRTMSLYDVEVTQEQCAESIETLGYEVVHNHQDLESDFAPLTTKMRYSLWPWWPYTDDHL